MVEWLSFIGYLLEMFGSFCVFWGFLWMLWDHRSASPGIVLGIAILCLVLGMAITGDW